MEKYILLHSSIFFPRQLGREVSSARLGDAPLEAPFPQTSRRRPSKGGPGVGGACFQPDGVPERSRTPRLRAQRVAPPTPQTCARCLRGARVLRCGAAGPAPAPGA